MMKYVRRLRCTSAVCFSLIIAGVIVYKYGNLNGSMIPVFSKCTCSVGSFKEGTCVETGATVSETTLGINRRDAGCLDRHNSKRLVTVSPKWLCGDNSLGNKMFVIASAYGIACLNNATFVLPPGNSTCSGPKQLRTMFTGISTLVSEVESTEHWTDLDELNHMHHSNYYLLEKNNYTISGFRQNWRYFKDYNQSVKALFEVANYYKTYAQRIIKHVKERYASVKNPVLIGVHIRRGDLRSTRSVKHGYVMANPIFYRRAMKIMHTRHGKDKVVFIVTSDTVSEAKAILKPLHSLFNIEIVECQGYFLDFVVLSQMDHMILSGGTYGFWAAWLSGGDVLYFDGFARAGSDLEKLGYRADAAFMPSWTPVSDDLD